VKRLLLALLLTLSAPAFADDKASNFLPAGIIAKHQATITRVQNYLSGLSTIVSDFTQVAPDGSLTSGKFFLKRPGKMRWQYNPPTPILIVSNGSEMVFYDYELEQVSHIPLEQTLIGFLAQEKIRFDTIVGITDFQEEAGVIRLTLAQREKPEDGQLMLEFSDNPLVIRNMVVTDATKQITTVALNNAQFGTKLNKELFIFRVPRQGRRR
jgi:outer membrane lipoprotein-sorting protein